MKIDSAVISMIFFHGLVATPFLVECIPSDGHGLIEVIGQDPCRDHYSLNDCHRYEDTWSMRPVDPGRSRLPCIDLALNNTDGTKTASNIIVPPPQASVSLALSESLLVPKPPGGSGRRACRQIQSPGDLNPAWLSVLRI